eukprot:m.77000 g.77000  ORF g.77000 m.77000 type:complete len:333 (-) comp8126_c0_seq2:439-1437(-)
MASATMRIPPPLPSKRGLFIRQRPAKSGFLSELRKCACISAASSTLPRAANAMPLAYWPITVELGNSSGRSVKGLSMISCHMPKRIMACQMIGRNASIKCVPTGRAPRLKVTSSAWRQNARAEWNELRYFFFLSKKDCAWRTAHLERGLDLVGKVHGHSFPAGKHCCPDQKVVVVQKVDLVELAVVPCDSHVVFVCSDCCRVGGYRFVVAAQADKDVGRHVQEVARVWRNTILQHLCRIESKFRGRTKLEDVNVKMADARVLGKTAQAVLEHGHNFLGFVTGGNELSGTRRLVLPKFPWVEVHERLGKDGDDQRVLGKLLVDLAHLNSKCLV